MRGPCVGESEELAHCVRAQRCPRVTTRAFYCPQALTAAAPRPDDCGVSREYRQARAPERAFSVLESASEQALLGRTTHGVCASEGWLDEVRGVLEVRTAHQSRSTPHSHGPPQKHTHTSARTGESPRPQRKLAASCAHTVGLARLPDTDPLLFLSCVFAFLRDPVRAESLVEAATVGAHRLLPVSAHSSPLSIPLLSELTCALSEDSCVRLCACTCYTCTHVYSRSQVVPPRS